MYIYIYIYYWQGHFINEYILKVCDTVKHLCYGIAKSLYFVRKINM